MTMNDSRAIAIVGVGASCRMRRTLPAFWNNIVNKRYCIADVPPERWSIADYYDPDPLAPDKTYSKIGGWVRGFEFDWKKYRMPPQVATAMDESQQWAVTIADEALADYGYPDRPLDLERTGVIMGTAMGGELHYLTRAARLFPEYANALESVTEFSQLPAGRARRPFWTTGTSVIDEQLAADYGRHDAGRTGQHRVRACGQSCSICAARTSSPTRPARRQFRRDRFGGGDC